MNHIKTMWNVSLFLMFSGTVFADFDYSDAPGYGVTRHDTANWHMLGSVWASEGGPRVPADNSDDGVSWSTDGGVTYGHGELTVGQSVTFKFDMWQSSTGRHDYDQIKAWIDWNGD